MVRPRRKFNVGDFVFAKIKGYPAWPAKIINNYNRKYIVYFYGTNETGNVKLGQLFEYVSSKESIVTDKNMKRKNFRTAVEEIEAAIARKDTAPIELTINEQREHAEIEVEVVSTVVETVPDAKALDVSHEIVPENSKKVSVRNRVKTNYKKNNKIEEKYSIDRKVSVNSPKRFVADADNDNQELPKPKRSKSKAEKTTSEMLAAAPQNDQSNISSIESAEIVDNIFLMYLPTHGECGIKMDWKSSDPTATLMEEQLSKEAAIQEAEILRNSILSGEIPVEIVSHRIIFNLDSRRIHPDASKRMEIYISELYSELDLESKFIDLAIELRASLGLKTAKTERAITILKEMKAFKFNKIMLLRNPDCVDVIRRVCKYIGNVTQWNLTQTQKKKFEEKSKIIRMISRCIYKRFYKVFNFSQDGGFWERFFDEVENFHAVYYINVQHAKKTITKSNFKILKLPDIKITRNGNMIFKNMCKKRFSPQQNEKNALMEIYEIKIIDEEEYEENMNNSDSEENANEADCDDNSSESTDISFTN